jgi:acyl-coenzyme A thioesterase PaaI-like protein
MSAGSIVRGEGRVLHSGRSLATAEGRLLAADGKLIAHATTTCMVLRPAAGG